MIMQMPNYLVSRRKNNFTTQGFLPPNKVEMNDIHHLRLIHFLPHAS